MNVKFQLVNFKKIGRDGKLDIYGHVILKVILEDGV